MTSSPSSTTSWLTNPVVALRLLTGFGAGAAFDLAETLRFVYTRLPSIGVSRTPSFSIEAALKTHGIGCSVWLQSRTQPNTQVITSKICLTRWPRCKVITLSSAFRVSYCAHEVAKFGKFCWTYLQ